MIRPLHSSGFHRSDATPRRGPHGALVFLCLMVLAGIGGAGWAAASPGARPAVAFVGIACLVATFGWLRALPDEASQQDLPTIVALALTIRLAVFLAIRKTVGPYVFAPDSRAYEVVGEEIVQAWQGLRELPLAVTNGFEVGYYYLNASLTWVFGSVPEAPALLNVFVGAWTTIPVYFLARSLARGNRGVGRWASFLVAVFPSLVLWSALNLREAPTLLLLIGAVYCFIRVQERFSVPTTLLGCACVVGLFVSRGYLAMLVMMAMPMGLLMARGKSMAGSLVGGVTLVALLVAGLAMNGFGAGLGAEPTLSTIEAMRRGLSLGAESAYGAAFDVSTVGGAVEFLPVGFAYFLFAPFPWAFGSTLQSVTIPEMLLWYSLVPFVVRGLVLALRHDARSYMVLIAVIVTLTVAYALVQGNVGTAFRHRGQLFPFLFIFAAVGLRDFYGARVARSRSARERRARASTHLMTGPFAPTNPLPGRGAG